MPRKGHTSKRTVPADAVYGSDLVPPATTMFEIHSNFTVDGQKQVVNGVLPSNHAEHETLEITEGWTNWFETGFYLFSSIQPPSSPDSGWNWVGDHIRPRFAVPESWHWPVGASISQEIGYQRRQFAEDTWDYELRPILDKQMGRCYFAVNPVFEWSFRGQNSSQGASFVPSAKFSYTFNKYFTGGAEYYGDFGSLTNISSFHNQQQEFFPTIDLNVSPDWEMSFGVGIGVTANTDDWIWKANISRRFDWTRHRAESFSRTQ